MCAARSKRILLIEDDRHIAEGLELNFRFKGYEVAIATDGPGGLRLWKEIHPDLIVLDIMLPGIDGLSVLRSIRLEDERLPILILSARGSADDRIEGLAHGGDDYLAKPFNLDELMLRVERLLLKDAWHRDSQAGVGGIPDPFVFGGNRICFRTATAHCANGAVVHLTDQESRLLKLFVASAGTPLSRSKLLKICWRSSDRVSTRTVDNFVVRLRRYFEKDPRRPRYFKSLRSVGYVFDPRSE